MRKLKLPSFISPHLLSALSGAIAGVAAAASAVVVVHGVQSQWKQQNSESQALDTTPFEVVDAPHVSIIGNVADGKRLYDVKFNVEAKNDGNKNMNFSWEVFSAHLLEMNGRRIGANAVLFDSPPDPFDDVTREVPIEGGGSLVWKPVACVEHADTRNPAVRRFLASLNCKVTRDGGGLTGVRPPHSTNRNANEILLEAHPGDFVGLSTAFGVNDCADESAAGCGLSQEIIPLP